MSCWSIQDQMFKSGKGQSYSLKIRGCNSIFPSAVYWISYTFLSGTESLFHRQMKLNPITVKLWNSVDHSNMFSKRALRIKHKRRERMGKNWKLPQNKWKWKHILGKLQSSIVTQYTTLVFWSTMLPLIISTDSL